MAGEGSGGSSITTVAIAAAAGAVVGAAAALLLRGNSGPTGDHKVFVLNNAQGGEIYVPLATSQEFTALLGEVRSLLANRPQGRASVVSRRPHKRSKDEGGHFAADGSHSASNSSEEEEQDDGFVTAHETPEASGRRLQKKKKKQQQQSAETAGPDGDDGGSGEASEFADIDEKQEKAEHQQAIHDEMLKIYSSRRDDGEVVWRYARAVYFLGYSMKGNDEERKRLMYKSLTIAEDGIRVGADLFAAHKWYAIIISSVKSEFEGMSEKIKSAYTFSEHIKKAIELNPNDASSRHLYGRWCFEIASLSWIERKGAAALFGAPPTATIEDAMEAFKKAESIDPGFWKRNTYFIGKCYLRLGNKAEGRSWLEKASRMASATEDDITCQGEIDTLLKQI